MTITQDIQTLTPGAFVELFELDMSMIPGAPPTPERFYAGIPNSPNPLLYWRGDAYTPWAMESSGFELNGKGQLPRPRIKVANVLGTITALVLQYQDIVGAKVTRYSTLFKYMDAVNYPSNVNPDADPAAEFPEEIYFVERKVTETKDVVEFELAASIDVWGVELPRRQIRQNACSWIYKSPECGWVPMGVFYKADDTVTGNPAEDRCGKRTSSCKCRFGDTNPLNFGSFPAAGLIR